MDRAADKTLQERRLIEAAERAAFGDGSITQKGSSAQQPTMRFELPTPESFPGYAIVREIHRGAQGVVYQAIQRTTKRKVAIKVMHDDPFSGPRGRARFEREVQILGQLSHPNIVGIHDSGSSFGNHYFVMDYISGSPLDVYMASADLSVRLTLELFAKICNALNAAHLRGVIHRDLKPGNIRIDTQGEPHILDFGLAKIASGGSSEISMISPMTVTGQFIGSLPWASPEQTSGSPDRLDLRTDVYSLGVILYQMLTGRFPYSVVGPMGTVLNNILHMEPTRPRTLRKEIDDEVETIVLKCLGKEPARRYQSAGELARDIGHYLRGEPIDAKRDSGWYVMRKTLRRYKAVAAVSVMFLVTIIGFGAGMSWMYGRASVAERKMRQAQTFLRDTFSAVRPDRINRSGPVRAELDEASRRAGVELADDPEAEAQVRDTLGGVYQSLGYFDDARVQLNKALTIRQRVLGPEHPDVAQSRHNLGQMLYVSGAYVDSERAYRDALDMRRRLLGEMNLATAASADGLGECLRTQGKYPEAVAYHSGALTVRRGLLPKVHLDVASSAHNLAAAHWNNGSYTLAQPLYEEALEIRRALLGNDAHVLTATTLNDLGALHVSLGQYAAAEPLYREALAMRRKLLGDDHGETAAAMNNLGTCLRDKGDYAGAETLLREAFRLVQYNQDVEGEAHQYRARGLTTLASCLIPLGKLQEAETHLHESFSLKQHILDENHPSMAHTAQLLGELYLIKDQPAEALPWAEEAMRIREASLPLAHPDRASGLVLYALVQLALGNPEAAEAPAREGLSIRLQTLPKDHWRIFEAQSVLGDCLTELGRLDEAEPLITSSTQRLQAIRPVDDPHLLDALARLEAFELARSVADAPVKHIAE